MNDLKLIDTRQFGEIKCDFYSDGKETWMTRDQIGAALEYSNPRVATAKIHARKKARLDRYSVVTKLVSPDGKAYDTTIYSRKGVMEICRHSDQPKADAFMDFCWEVMDGLMSGKQVNPEALRVQGLRNKAMALNAATRSGKFVRETMREAGMDAQYIAVAIGTVFSEAGIALPLDGLTVPERFMDQTAIAKELGILVASSSKPSSQAVGGIIDVIGVLESEVKRAPFTKNGHSADGELYAESVVTRIAKWLEDNGFPPTIKGRSGKNQHVKYVGAGSENSVPTGRRS